MNKDHRDLIRRLFTLATELLEDTHGFATKGQSSRLRAKDYAACAQQLAETGQNLAATAQTILTTLKPISRQP